jgi:hypothetical protein
MLNIGKFEEKMAAFNFADHQKILTYHKTLERNGLTLEDVKEYVNFKRVEFAEMEAIMSKHNQDLEKILPICPECGSKMGLRIVSRPEGPSNIHGWKSCLECTGENCAAEKYSKMRPERIINLLSSKHEEGKDTNLNDIETEL